ncbi:hypothetical protein ACGGAI_23885 [Streptomyces antibioticus]|uniref:hypothetical protein n=1 Tax=Streptomyces antibioticus TaxID=1890 RepID=UPI00371B9251
MGDEITPEQAATESLADTGGADEQPSRIAGGCVVLILVGVGVLVVKVVVTAAPYTAYFVAGILCTVGVQKARARWAKGRSDGQEDQEEATQPDVTAALRRLIGDDKGVLLTRLQKDLGLPDTKAVKALLKAEGIPWKAGRTREGNGPSVRREAIPPAPSPAVTDAHGDGCCCRSDGNSNSDNGPFVGTGEGIRVERTNGGYVIYDPADTHRHTTVSNPRGRTP